MTVETPFGTVYHGDTGMSITAHAGQLHAWAWRPGSHWPCSVLADDEIDNVTAVFDHGDLVDLIVSDENASAHLPADEFNAWADDCATAAGVRHLLHP